MFNSPTASTAPGKLASYTLKSGVQAKFSYSGNDLTKVENSLGRSLTFTNSAGRISSVTDGNARSVSYGYDTSNNLTQFTDATTQSTSFEYDLPGRMTKIFYPSTPTNAFMVNVYDTLGRVRTQTNANGKLYTYYFAGSRSEEAGPLGVNNVSYLDGQGHVLRAIDPLGKVTSNTYDGAGRLAKTVLPEGNSVEYSYDDAPCAASDKRCTHNVKTVVQRPKPGSPLAALTSSFTYESSFNKVLTSTNARGKITDFSYHPAHGEINTITAPADAVGNRPQTSHAYTSYTAAAGFLNFYLPTGQTRKISATATVTNTTSYNASNKYVPATSVVDSGGLNLTSTFTYDAVGNLQAVDGPRSDVSDTASFIYDKERRLLQTTNALGKLSKQGYDADGRPVRSAAQIGTQWLVSCTRYTLTGKPQRSWGPALTGADTTCPAEAAPVPITDIVYDDQDRTQRVTQSLTTAEGGNRITETSYFADGRVQAASRAVGTPLAQTYAAYTYTPNGLPATLTDARGYRSSYEYDGFDRRTKLLYPNPGTAGASSTTDFEQYGFDENANVVSLRRRSGQTISLGYDNLDRLISRNYPVAADNVVFGYDLLGRRLSANFADGSHNIGYAWDNAGRLLSSTAGSRTLSYQYDAAGNRTRITWPDAAFYISTAYDALNRPTNIKEQGAATLADYSAYDDLSRRASITLGNGTATAYNYDNQGTLAGLAHNLGGTAQDVAFGYGRNQALEIITHNWNNNAYQWKGATDGMRSYSANGLNQYTNVAGATLSHDASGNTNSDGTWTWGYDADNQLKTATRSGTSVALAYDAAGRMRQETYNGSSTQFLYDGVDLVAEYDASGNLLRRYVHGPGIDEPLVAYQGSGTSSKEWLYADHLGSVVASADSGGTSTAVYAYGAFGEPNQSAGVRFRYTGQTFMPNLGLYYYKARFYSPVIGRFMQTDPIGYGDGLNLYAYVGNDPVNLTDPTGNCPSCIGALIGGGIDVGLQLLSNGGSFSNVSWGSVAVSAGLGAVGSIGAGRLTSQFLSTASNSTKGVIGDVAAGVKGLAQGRVPYALQQEVALSKSYTVADQFQRSLLTGKTVIVEAKYGKSTLTAPQRRAVKELDNYEVIRTPASQVIRAGEVAGGTAGGLIGTSIGGSSSGDSGVPPPK